MDLNGISQVKGIRTKMRQFYRHKSIGTEKKSVASRAWRWEKMFIINGNGTFFEVMELFYPLNVAILI